MKKWVVFLILSVGFCITSVSCIKESSTFHWSVMVTNKTESAVYWAFAWTQIGIWKSLLVEILIKFSQTKLKKYQFYTALIPSKER